MNKIIPPAGANQYAVIPTAIFKIKGITPDAVGLYCYCYTKKSSKEITQKSILRHFKYDLRRLNKAMDILIQKRFLMPYNASNEENDDSQYFVVCDAPMEKENIEGIYNYNNIYNKYNNISLQDNNIDIIKQDNCNNSNIDIIKQDSYNNRKIDIIQQPRNAKNAFSDNVNKSFEHFVALFPERYRPKSEAQKNKWMDCLDKIERLDNYDLRDIYVMAKKMRNDYFWQNNFLSILKLRNTDQNGIKYVDRFMALQDDYMKTARQQITGLVKFYKYTNPDGNICLGAKTKTGDVDADMLAQKLPSQTIEKILSQL